MIDLDYFEDDRFQVEEILAVTAGHLSRQSGHDARLRLVPALDTSTRTRVLELGDEVFGARNEVFDLRALDEVAGDPDALFVTLELDGTLEGVCFGYYEGDGLEVVDGTDFFLDSALVAPRWQHRRLGWLAGAATLLVIAQLGDVRRVGLAVWTGGDLDGLLSLYHRFGFVDATSTTMPYPCLAVTLEPARVDGWRALLGLGPSSVSHPMPRTTGRPSRPRART